jgi:hypothetical protein
MSGNAKLQYLPDQASQIYDKGNAYQAEAAACSKHTMIRVWFSLRVAEVLSE